MSETRREVEHAAVRVLAEAKTLEEAAPAIIEGVCRALSWEFGAMWVLDSSSDQLRCVELWRRSDEELGPFESASRETMFRKGTGLPGRVWSTVRPAWIRDVVQDTNFPRAPIAARAGLHGALGFPICVNGEFFGVMEFFSREIREPDSDLLDMMGTIGTQIGQFIEREQLGRRLVYHAALLEAQGEAAIDGIVIMSADNTVLHWNKRFLEIWGIPDELMQARDPQPVIEHKARQTPDPARFTTVLQSVLDDPLATRRDEIQLSDGRVIDRWAAPVHGLDDTPDGRVLYYRDITAQKRTEQRLRENEQWYSFLAEVGTVLSQTLDYRRSLGQLAQMAVPVLGDWCAIHVIEANGDIRPVAVAHVDPVKADTARRLQERYPVDPQAEIGLADVVRRGSSILYEEIPEEVLERAAQNEEHVVQLRYLGFRSAMIVPLICRDRVLGTLTLVRGESGPRYTKEDLGRAEDLAGRAAFPIDNARLYEERARVAHTLQESLLPPELPNIAGVELAARYHPVAESADVGGDFYDVFGAGARSWGLFLGDVSGKGVEAATVTSLARHTLRAATMATQRPSEILSMLNAALLEQTEPDRFCTAVYGLVEPRFGRVHVTVASGGHPVPCVVRSNGTLEHLPCEGTLLGVVPDPELRDVAVELDFGDKLICYTDGILDVRPMATRFGQPQLDQLFRECGRRGVKASADLIERTVLDLQGGQARDDFALVILGVRASIFRRVRTPRLWGRSAGERPPER